MPGKYSHSVVLADYSSRGLIALPNDQHIAYLRSSAYPPSSYSRSSIKGQSQASLSGSTRNRSQSNSSYQEQPSPTVPDLSSSRRHVAIDPTARSDKEQKTGLGLINQPQLTSERRKLRSESAHGRLVRDTPTPSNHLATKSHIESNVNHPTPPSSSHATKSALYGSPSSPRRSSEGKRVRYKQPEIVPQPTSTSHVRNEAEPAATVKSKTSSATRAQYEPVVVDVKKPAVKSLKRIDPLGAHPPQVEISRNKESPTSINTQIYRPLSTIGEPDFDGFSDAEESKSSYFDNPPQPRATGKPDGGMGMLSSLRNTETPPPRQSTRSRNSQTRTLNSSSTVPSERHTTVSPDDFHNKLDSLTSQSSLGSWGISAGSPGIKQHERKISASTAEGPNSQWQLPEIDELREFGPDLFTQGPEDDVRPASSKLAFGESTLGMISSGRDFDADDAASLASAACPPNINRFREEDAPPVPHLKVPERMSAETWTSSPSNTPSKSKKGIFSKLRSMSRTR